MMNPESKELDTRSLSAVSVLREHTRIAPQNPRYCGNAECGTDAPACEICTRMYVGYLRIAPAIFDVCVQIDAARTADLETGLARFNALDESVAAIVGRLDGHNTRSNFASSPASSPMTEAQWMLIRRLVLLHIFIVLIVTCFMCAAFAGAIYYFVTLSRN
jgi:hypothetical protein